MFPNWKSQRKAFQRCFWLSRCFDKLLREAGGGERGCGHRWRCHRFARQLLLRPGGGLLGRAGKSVSDSVVLLGGQRYLKRQAWKCLMYTQSRVRLLNVFKKEEQDCQGPRVGWRALHVTKRVPDPVAPGSSSYVLQGVEVFPLGTGDLFLMALGLPFLQVRPSPRDTHKHSHAFPQLHHLSCNFGLFFCS